jgi:cell division protein FtsB
MLNTTEIQVNSIIAELRVQRELANDRAANIAVELAVVKAEKEVLEAVVKNLQDQLKSAVTEDQESQN